MTKKIDKYDVFKKETNNTFQILPIFLYRRMKLKLLKYKLSELEKMDLQNVDNLLKYRDLEEKYDIEMAKILIDASSILKTSAHIVYEISKDLEEIDPQSFKNYLQELNITSNSFNYRLEEKQNDALYFLAFYALLEKNGKPIESLSPDEILAIISSFGTKNYEVTKEDVELLEKIQNKYFSFESLTDYEKQLIDNYHEKYMDEVIYKDVTNRRVSEQKILKKVGNLYYQN